MIICLDVDEVLRNTMKGILDMYNREYSNGDIKTYEDIKGWNLKEFLPNLPDNEEFFKKHAREIFYDTPSHENANLFNGVYDHTVYVVTSQFKGLEFLTDKWLGKNLITSDGVIYTHDKSKVGDILLDDGVHNLEKYCGKAVCMDRPWNQEWIGDRVKSIKEFYERFIRGQEE